MSDRKFANAQYTTVLTPTEVLVYDDMGDLQRSISSKAILRGWRCKHSGLWQVSLTPVVLNKNTNTMLIDWTNPEHAINSAYKFPSSEQMVRYLHACTGYPTKETWLKEIWAGNYLSWPGLTTKKSNRHYPETDETPKGHMWQVRQGVRSTKKKLEVLEEEDDSNKNARLRKYYNIYVRIDQVRDTIYT